MNLNANKSYIENKKVDFQMAVYLQVKNYN